MRTMLLFSRWLLTSSLVLALGGCDLFEEEKPPPAASADSELGRPLNDVELPVSLRIQDAAPTGAHQVEATDAQLRLGGEPVVALVSGKVADADRQDGLIPKLESRLRKTSRSVLALRLQANLPYETLALVLNTARKAGVRDAAFRVRSTGDGEKTGWLVAKGYVMSSKADDLPPITATKALGWNDFTEVWQAVFDGCRTSPNGSCAYVNENVAEGGTLKVELMASGRGVNVNFFRRGLTPEQEAEEDRKRAQELALKKEDFIQGRITEEEMTEALLLGDPSTYALFQFRLKEALKSPSALTQTMKPVCHERRCGVVVTADTTTSLLHIVSLIGAAFPDGTPGPAFAFEMPWTERPKPAVLSEWIARQQAK